jgi:uncharacterized membrane protein
MNQKNKMSVRTMALGAVLTALVVVLQLLGTFVRFGPFQISLVLVPIVIGAAAGGAGLGGWLGAIFGLVVLLNGDAAAFLAVNAVGTVITVMAKGTLCGVAAGKVYRLLAARNKTAAVVAAALTCPVVNTGIFLVGCFLFFMNTLAQWGQSMGFTNVFEYMIFGLVGANFLVELGVNAVLSPVILRLLKQQNL